MEIYDNYFWIILLIFTGIGVFSRRRGVQKYIDRNPELKKGYNQYYIWSTILWIIPAGLVAYGVLSGTIGTLFELFDFSSDKWVIQLLYAYLISVQIFMIWWMFFYKGAEFYMAHPGLREFRVFGRAKNSSARQIKMVYFIQVLILVGILFAVWHFDLITKFRVEFMNQ